jgi:hypothetical protein
VDKKLANVSGFVTPNLRFNFLNVNACAEWSWNAHGRTVDEFMYAWAAREGLAEPQGLVQWNEIMGPVSCDIYGCQIPKRFRQDIIEKQYIQNRKSFQLGGQLYTFFPTLDHFEKNITATVKALEIAEQIDNPLFINETLTVQGYTLIMKHIYHIAEILAAKSEYSQQDKEALSQYLTDLVNATQQTLNALKTWEKAVSNKYDVESVANHDDKDATFSWLFGETLENTQKTTAAIARELEKIGIQINLKTIF